MCVDLLLPTQGAGRRIHAVYEGANIAEVRHGRAVLGVADDNRSADAAIGLEYPVLAAILQTQRVDTARSAADQHAIADDRGIGGRGVFPVEADGPFQFQVGGLRRQESRLRLKPIVGRRHAPGAPVRRRRAHGAGAFTTRSAGGGVRCRGRNRPGRRQVGRDRAPLLRSQRLALNPHRAGLERRDDALGRECGDDVARRRSRDLTAFVTRRAALRVERTAVLREGRCHDRKISGDRRDRTFHFRLRCRILVSQIGVGDECRSLVSEFVLAAVSLWRSALALRKAATQG